MGTLADLRFGDVGRALGRYRPVAVVVAVITVVALLLPAVGIDAGSAAPAPFDPGFSGDPTSVTAPIADVDPPVVAAPSGGLTAAAPLFEVDPSPAPTTGTFRPSSPPASGGPAPGGADPAAPPATTAPPAPGTPTPSSPPPAGDGPVSVAESLWTSATGAGTPVGAAGVPDGTLPVGTRVGAVDKASYVRLSGGGSVLVLGESAEGARTATGAPVVQACRATDESWEPGANADTDAAPAVDEGACVPGTRSDDGTWRFDLGPLGPSTGRAGVALLPGPDAPVDFQIAFLAAG